MPCGIFIYTIMTGYLSAHYAMAISFKAGRATSRADFYFARTTLLYTAGLDPNPLLLGLQVQLFLPTNTSPHKEHNIACRLPDL